MKTEKGLIMKNLTIFYLLAVSIGVQAETSQNNNVFGVWKSKCVPHNEINVSRQYEIKIEKNRVSIHDFVYFDEECSEKFYVSLHDVPEMRFHSNFTIETGEDKQSVFLMKEDGFQLSKANLYQNPMVNYFGRYSLKNNILEIKDLGFDYNNGEFEYIKFTKTNRLTNSHIDLSNLTDGQIYKVKFPTK